MFKNVCLNVYKGIQFQMKPSSYVKENFLKKKSDNYVL